MLRCVMTVAGLLLGLTFTAAAQTPSPEALDAARKLVTTMKTADQYRALLPQLLLKLRPVVTQDRPEIERDFDALTAPGSDIYAPISKSMIDQIVALYATSFTVDELRQIEAFYTGPAGRKFLDQSDTISQQAAQITQKATDDLKQRLTEALRQKGHKL